MEFRHYAILTRSVANDRTMCMFECFIKEINKGFLIKVMMSFKLQDL